MKILKIFLMAIIFFTILISCKEELKNNYYFVESVLINPDILDSLLIDTSKVTIHYHDSEIRSEFINKYKKIISDDFKLNGFKTVKDYTMNYIDQKTNEFRYTIHRIKLASKKTNQILMFKFTTEDRGIWKFDYLTDYDNIEKGSFLP